MPPSAASKMASAAKGGGTKIREAVAPPAFTASFTVLKTGIPSTLAPPLPRGHPAHDLGSILPTSLGVKRSRGARDPLDDHLRVVIDENAHDGTSSDEGISAKNGMNGRGEWIVTAEIWPKGT